MKAWSRATVSIGAMALALAGLTGCATGVADDSSDAGGYEAQQRYWYCWDEGELDPHHLGKKVDGDHLCTDTELVDSGFTESTDGRWNRTSTSSQQTDDAAPESVDVETTNAAEADLQVLADLQPDLGEWNEAAAGFLSGYLDEGVDGETWVADADAYLSTMDDTRTAVLTAAYMIADPDLSAWLQQSASIRYDQLSAAEALVSAVEYGTEDDQQTAWDDLTQAGGEGRDHALTLPDALEGMASDDEVEDLRAMMTDTYQELLAP